MKAVTLFFYFCLFICSMVSLFFGLQCKKKATDIALLNNEEKEQTNTKYKILSFIFLFLTFLIMFLPAMLRKDIGVDYKLYATTYENIVNGEISETTKSWLGHTFIWICQLLGFLFGNNAFIFFAIMSFITVFFMLKAICKQSSLPVVSLCLYYAFCLYLQSYNQARQCVSFSLCAWAFSFLKEKKVWKFLIVLLFACFFHNSAIVVLPLALLYKMPLNKKTIIAYVSLAVIVFAAYPLIVKLLQFTSYGERYFGELGYNVSFDKNVILNTLIRACLLTLCLLVFKPCMQKNEKNLIYYHLIILCMIVQIITIRNRIFSRITTYFFLGYIFLVPDVLSAYIEKFKNHKFLTKNVMMVAFFTACTCYFLVYYFSASGAVGCGYDIYKSIFGK